MKYLYICLFLVLFAATSCLGDATLTAQDVSAVADEKKPEKRGIYGFGHGFGGYYGGGYGGFGHYGHGHGYGHGFGYPSHGYAFHGPSYGHAYYPHVGGYHHGFH